MVVWNASDGADGAVDSNLTVALAGDTRARC